MHTQAVVFVLFTLTPLSLVTRSLARSPSQVAPFLHRLLKLLSQPRLEEAHEAVATLTTQLCDLLADSNVAHFAEACAGMIGLLRDLLVVSAVNRGANAWRQGVNVQCFHTLVGHAHTAKATQAATSPSSTAMVISIACADDLACLQVRCLLLRQASTSLKCYSCCLPQVWLMRLLATLTKHQFLAKHGSVHTLSKVLCAHIKAPQVQLSPHAAPQQLCLRQLTP